MMKSNLFQTLVTTVRFRITSLESEIDILDTEIPLISKMPGTVESDQTKLILHRNIKAVLHDVLVSYLDHFISLCPKDSNSLKDVVKFHLQVFSKQDMNILIHELFGQQSALNTFVGKDYEKYSHDFDVPDDMQLRMLTQVFPYEFEYDLLTNPKFFTFLLKIVKSYSVNNHEDCIKKLFERISIEKPKTVVYFFTADNPLYFALAEHFLTSFVHDLMLHCEWDALENFAILEKCRLISAQGPLSCCVSEKTIEKLKNSEKIPKTMVDIEISSNLRCLSSRISKIDETIFKNIDIPQIHHIVLDLKRLKYQTSPSFVLCVLANSLYWLTNAITTDGNVVGADEIFQLFVYSLAHSEPENLPALHFFVERFLDEGLNETKFSYLLTQLRCALEFIQQKLLQVPPCLIFPFEKPVRRLAGRMVKHDSIVLHGFKVYAFPTYRKEKENFFPALLPTLNGSFLQLTEEYIEICQMILIDTGKYDSKIDDIEALSILMKFAANVKNPKLSEIENVFNISKKLWKFEGNILNENIKIKVAEVQRALVVIGELPNNSPINGVLDFATNEILCKRFKLGENDKLTPDMFENIKRQMKTKFLPNNE
ncbi:hypothetical protein TRFO_03256 [Tritrichomonas foetus]|uniref:VPS9 domain-containing protein n=1 Tax=Tritrichomonas foetus TaxID=1144522 RepID=A0A1J4KQG1_9EUKA|nr:hypothetical protein TRFO_03256 [Tritrichomonas foetus]|eukprot:OHT13527.1 hypothetical protein TRFO_03256 [Tritrichomonas foetus]